MLKSRAYKLLAGKVDHDTFLIESFGTYLVSTKLGVLDGREVYQRLAFDPVDKHLLHIILAVVFEIVKQIGFLQLFAYAVQPKNSSWFALSKAQLDEIITNTFAMHASHGFDDTF